MWTGPPEDVDRITAARIDAETAGIDLTAHSQLADGLRGLVRAIERADDRQLCAAVPACTEASGTLCATTGTQSVDQALAAADALLDRFRADRHAPTRAGQTLAA